MYPLYLEYIKIYTYTLNTCFIYIPIYLQCIWYFKFEYVVDFDTIQKYTVYSVQWTLYTVHCTMYTIQIKLYSVQ